MKIGFDAKRYYHNRTGLGNYSRTIVNGLQQYCPDDEYCLYDEGKVGRLLSFGRKAKAEGCDLLHGLSNELPLDVPRVGLTTLVTIHDVAWRTFPGMYHWADRQIYDFKYGRSCRVATHVVAISESTKRDVMRFYGIPEEKISVIYQPVQLPLYQPMDKEESADIVSRLLGDDAQRGYVLNVGSINSRKNLLGLVQAMERIPREHRPLLLVVGNGREYKQEVLQYVARKDMQKDIRIETNIHDCHLLQALYAQALVMAYPSHYEGFGLPVVEAALQECPVLTSNVSSLPEAAGPGALLCDPAEVDSIHDRLTELLDHPDEARRLGKVASEYARSHFDPELLTLQMHQLYHSLV